MEWTGTALRARLLPLPVACAVGLAAGNKLLRIWGRMTLLTY